MMTFHKSKTNLLSLSLAIALSAFVSQEAFSAPEVGTSAAVRGNVFVTTRGAKRKAAVRQSIKLQDQVLTKDDSALQILLLDRSTFTVGQNCSMTIDRFVYDPDTSVGKISANIAKGAFRFMSGRIGQDNPTNASLSTPSATIGIRGTFLEGIVGEDALALAGIAGLDTTNACSDQASLVVLRGPGRRRNTLDRSGTIEVSNSAGRTLISQPNYAVFIPCIGAAPSAPFKLTPAMQDYLDFFLRSEPNGPPVNPDDEDNTGGVLSGQNDRAKPEGNNDDETTDVEVGIQDDPVEPEEIPDQDPSDDTEGGETTGSTEETVVTGGGENVVTGGGENVVTGGGENVITGSSDSTGDNTTVNVSD